MLVGEYENKYQKVSFDQMGPRHWVVHHESKNQPGVDGRTLKCEHFQEWLIDNAFERAEKMFKEIKARMQYAEKQYDEFLKAGQTS